MIYFVVAQKDEDGEWELVFGPKDNLEEVDAKISELDKNPKYCQIELARVITSDDKLDQIEWGEM